MHVEGAGPCVVSVKANWFMGNLSSEDDDSDPFESIPEAVVEDVGQLIDLRDDATLNQALFALVGQEKVLYDRGVRCEIRDDAQTACSACPLRGLTPDLKPLCIVGADQERVLTELAISRARRNAAAS